MKVKIKCPNCGTERETQLEDTDLFVVCDSCGNEFLQSESEE